MVNLKCSECGSRNLTTDSKNDIECKDCGYASYADNFRLEDLGCIYIVYKSSFNADKPRAQDVSPSVYLTTSNYDKAKNKLREIGGGYDLEDWDIEDLEKYDHFEYRDEFRYIFCSIKKLKMS